MRKFLLALFSALALTSPVLADSLSVPLGANGMVGSTAAPIGNGYFTSMHLGTGYSLCFSTSACSSSQFALWGDGTNLLVNANATGSLNLTIAGSTMLGISPTLITIALPVTSTSTVTATNLYTTASLPTISSCGTSPPAATAGSSARAGQFTLGTGATAACTVTFATAYPNYAYCTVTPAFAYAGTYYVSASSKTAFTVTLGTGTASVVFNYSCGGN